MIKILESIAVVLPPGEIERIARTQFEQRSDPLFRKGKVAADSHIGDVLIRPALGGAPRRGRSRPTAERHLVPEPVGQEILVIRHEAEVDAPRRKVFDDPGLRVRIAQALREGDVEVSLEVGSTSVATAVGSSRVAESSIPPSRSVSRPTARPANPRTSPEKLPITCVPMNDASAVAS